MGGGEWTTDIYEARVRAKAASGKSTFDYSDRVRSTSRDRWVVNPKLDPDGVKWRESRDSVDHPESLAIAILFDVTGSMLTLPQAFQKKLKDLHGLLRDKNYVDDPQILFGAIGDATCDRVPLQIGQFESDNRMDENLEAIFLEGGGGGQKTESYELAMYFMARHTDIDCWNIRRHKGYLFLIGDEMAYDQVKRREVREQIGDSLKEDIPTQLIVNELKQRFETYYILPQSASYGGDTAVLGHWRNLLGQNVIELEDANAVCETIALQIGINEGRIDLDKGIKDLADLGVSRGTRDSVTRALALRSGPMIKGSVGLPGLSNP